MIKMFASDLDGTLLNALHEADGTIRRAIRELTEAGLHVVPATGRSTLPIGEHGFTGLGTRRLLLQRIHRARQPW